MNLRTSAVSTKFPPMTKDQWADLDKRSRDQWGREQMKLNQKKEKAMQNKKSAALEILRVASMIISDEDAVEIDPIDIAAKFTADVAKELMRFRNSHGLVSIRQNYKGTGRQRASRQLWVRLENGAVDVWLNPGSYGIGGVTQMRLPGEFGYGPKSPADVAKEIADKINVAFNVKTAKIAKTLKATTFLDGLRKPQAAKKVNEIMARHTRGFFKDQSWEPINAIWKDFQNEGIDYTLDKASYAQNSDGTPISKTWRFTVSFKNQAMLPNTLYGTITASGAGSTSDPLSVYDVIAYCS